MTEYGHTYSVFLYESTCVCVCVHVYVSIYFYLYVYTYGCITLCVWSAALYSGEKGSTVLTMKPTILVCDLTLPPGDSQTCQ